MTEVLIAGGGRVGAYLTTLLLDAGWTVTLIESDPARVEQLGHLLPAGHLVLGDGTDPDTLESAGIRRASAVVTVTHRDETNLVIASMAKFEFGVPRTIGRVNNPNNAWLYTDEMGVDVALNQADIIGHLVVEEMSLGEMMTLLKLRRGLYVAGRGAGALDLRCRRAHRRRHRLAGIVRTRGGAARPASDHPTRSDSPAPGRRGARRPPQRRNLSRRGAARPRAGQLTQLPKRRPLTEPDPGWRRDDTRPVGAGVPRHSGRANRRDRRGGGRSRSRRSRGCPRRFRRGAGFVDRAHRSVSTTAVAGPRSSYHHGGRAAMLAPTGRRPGLAGPWSDRISEHRRRWRLSALPVTAVRRGASGPAPARSMTASTKEPAFRRAGRGLPARGESATMPRRGTPCPAPDRDQRPPSWCAEIYPGEVHECRTRT